MNQRVPPVAIASAELAAVTVAFARQEGIDLYEQHVEEVADENTAILALNAWKRAMPKVASAYRPSGALPAAAIGRMALGAALGAIVGALADGVLLVLTLIVALLVGVPFVMEGLSLCGISALVVGVVGCAGAFGLTGIVAAAVTVDAGQRGYNRMENKAAAVRNVTAAALFSILSATAAVLLLRLLGPLWPVLIPRQIDVREDDIRFAYQVVLVVGGAIANLAAVYLARIIVLASKYCEDCGRFTIDRQLRSLNLGGTRAFARAAAAGQSTVAVGLLEGLEGEQGQPILSSCPVCGQGYVELTIDLSFTWKVEDAPKVKGSSWLVASVALPTADVARLSAYDIDEIEPKRRACDRPNRHL